MKWRFLESESCLVYSITLQSRWDTENYFATNHFCLILFLDTLLELAVPVNAIILSSRLFYCKPLFLFPFTAIGKIVFEKRPNLLSFRFLNTIRSSPYYRLDMYAVYKLHHSFCCPCMKYSITHGSIWIQSSVPFSLALLPMSMVNTYTEIQKWWESASVLPSIQAIRCYISTLVLAL